MEKDLGSFTISKEETLDIEYPVRQKVEKAINTCIDSAGTNQLTAYSKEELVKALIKIVEEKLC